MCELSTRYGRIGVKSAASVLFGLAAVLMLGCSSSPHPEVRAEQRNYEADFDYVIGPGDSLVILRQLAARFRSVRQKVRHDYLVGRVRDFFDTWITAIVREAASGPVRIARAQVDEERLRVSFTDKLLRVFGHLHGAAGAALKPLVRINVEVVVLFRLDVIFADRASAIARL